MEYYNLRSPEYDKEMKNFLNIYLKQAKLLGLYTSMNGFDISSGNLVISNLHNTGPTYHHVINYDFPIGSYPAILYQDSFQSILVNFRESVPDSLIRLEQVHMTPFEGNIIEDDYRKINPNFRSVEFNVNGPAASLMDVNSLKEYAIRKKNNPADHIVASIDSFANASDSEKIVHFGTSTNSMLVKPIHGQGIYFAWIGINLVEEIEFLLIDFHMVYHLRKEK